MTAGVAATLALLLFAVVLEVWMRRRARPTPAEWPPPDPSTKAD